jgi:hypothetical protein
VSAHDVGNFKRLLGYVKIFFSGDSGCRGFQRSDGKLLGCGDFRGRRKVAGMEGISEEAGKLLGWRGFQRKQESCWDGGVWVHTRIYSERGVGPVSPSSKKSSSQDTGMPYPLDYISFLFSDTDFT